MAKGRENLIPFKKGFDQNRNLKGRPKRMVSNINDELRSEGYEGVTYDDVVSCMRLIVNLPYSKLVEIANKDTDYPLLYKLIAKELIGKNGGQQLDKILDRVFGRTKTQVEEDVEEIIIKERASQDLELD